MLWLTLINHCQIWCAQESHGQTQPCTAVLLVGSQGMCGSWEELSHLSFPLPKLLTTFIGPQWCDVLVSRVGFWFGMSIGATMMSRLEEEMAAVRVRGLSVCDLALSECV